MIKGEYDYLKALAEINECAEHGMPLVVATHPEDACYVLRCGEGHYPDTIRRIPTLTEEYKQGNLPDGPIADNIKKGSKKRAMSTNRQLQTQVLGELPRADLATGEMLAPETVHALMVYARKYDLDPYRGHVVIYYGKPYIGIDGYLYHANQTGKGFQLRSRPLTEDERITYLAGEGNHAWLCEIIIGDNESSFTGLGIVTREEMEARSPTKPEKLRSPVVAAHPWQLAQKRAEWQALRRAFPIGETEEITKKEEGHEPTNHTD